MSVHSLTRFGIREFTATTIPVRRESYARHRDGVGGWGEAVYYGGVKTTLYKHCVVWSYTVRVAFHRQEYTVVFTFPGKVESHFTFHILMQMDQMAIGY